MGNSESKGSSSGPQSPVQRTSSQRERRQHGGPTSDPRRRESLAPNHFSNISASRPGPPTATLISSAVPSTSHQQDIVSASPASSHRRQRSTTTTSTPKLVPFDSQSNEKSTKSEMGGDQSKPRPPSRSSTLPIRTSTPAPDPEPKPIPSPSAQPVDVPERHQAPQDEPSFEPSDAPGESPYGQPSANFSRPPRLPLPIEEEVLSPGSPIMSPHDFGQPVDQQEMDGMLGRRTSMLSSTTMDEDEGVDREAFTAEPQQPSYTPTFTTTLEWDQGGDKVYVTGTFVQWERKFKLHKDKERPGIFTATLQLKPGTHHLKFLVDGDMQTSTTLPTTVDYTNILVNYIEVVAPMPSQPQQPAPAEPMPIPGAAMNRGQAEATEEGLSQAIDIPASQHPAADLSAAQRDAPPEAPTQAHQRPRSQSPSPRSQVKKDPKPPRPQQPRARYTSHIPDFLLDLDKYITPEDESFQRASRVIGHLPQPPSLPMFLGKSILNGTTPHKDDASVLIMPNHTVLNHLATSSIRNGVLATSGTTRYKRKFLTTIMYKPTSDDG